MQTRALCRYGIALALVLTAGCASDLWYKKGAGTAALAQDKAACSAEGAQLSGAKANEAFEQCMSARDWYHVARGRSSAAPEGRKVARARTREAAIPAAPAQSALAAPAAPTSTSTSTPTPEGDTALATPPVDAGPQPTSLEVETPLEEEEEELQEAALAPEPVDPRSRQFWIKLGAGPGQLEADQERCRRELGVPDGETQPSRWGQSEDFDACMRGRGWGGGSVSAVPNR